MRALVIYESMYGNTHLVANAIARGLLDGGLGATAIAVNEVTPQRLDGVGLIVVGGPTHAHSMSRTSTREAAIADANEPDSVLHLDSDATGEGLREWFDSLPADADDLPLAAAFDTRFHLPVALTGKASKGISKRLRRHGFTELVEPESFFVAKGNTLEADEEQRAAQWGRQLGRAAMASTSIGTVTADH